jgi:DNA-binding MarR family transcriptional regulator
MHSRVKGGAAMEALFDDDCFAIRQATRHVSQIYDRHLANVGLTITQFSLMNRLKWTGPMTMKQIGEIMRMQRTTVVRTIQPLRRDGLVTSEAMGADARALVISLTDAGMERVSEGRPHWYAAQAEFEHSFGEQRAASLRRELFAVTGDSL